MSRRGLVFVLLSGALFGFGLAISTMVKPEVVISFLLWRDMGLLLVLGGAVAATFVIYRLAPRVMGKPWAGAAFNKHPSAMAARTILRGDLRSGVGVVAVPARRSRAWAPATGRFSSRSRL